MRINEAPAQGGPSGGPPHMLGVTPVLLIYCQRVNFQSDSKSDILLRSVLTAVEPEEWERPLSPAFLTFVPFSNMTSLEAVVMASEKLHLEPH